MERGREVDKGGGSVGGGGTKAHHTARPRTSDHDCNSDALPVISQEQVTVADRSHSLCVQPSSENSTTFVCGTLLYRERKNTNATRATITLKGQGAQPQFALKATLY